LNIIKLKKIFSSKSFIFIITVFLVISLIILSISYATKPYKVLERNIKYIEFEAKIESKIYLEPSLLYDYREYIVSNEAVLSLVKNTTIRITPYYVVYTGTELGNISGIEVSYDIKSLITIGEWVKPINITSTNRGKNVDHNTIVFPINFSEIKRIVNIISKEASVKIPTYTCTLNIKFVINVYYENSSKTYIFQPSVSFIFSSEQNKLLIKTSGLSNEVSSTKKVVIENKIMGFNILILRTSTLYLSIPLSILLFIYLGLNSRNIIVKDENYYSRRYGVPVIKVKKVLSNKRTNESVIVLSLVDLFMVARALSSPILVDVNNCFHVYGDNIEYRYCREESN